MNEPFTYGQENLPVPHPLLPLVEWRNRKEGVKNWEEGITYRLKYFQRQRRK